MVLFVFGSVSSAAPQQRRGAGGDASSGAAELVPRSYSQAGGSAAADEGRRLPGEEEPREALLRPVGAVVRSLQTFPRSEQGSKQIESSRSGPAVTRTHVRVSHVCQ